MRLLVDENIALIEHFFCEPYQVKSLQGRAFNADEINNFKAQALVVRSISKITPDLLIGSKVGFVGSATIGTDHIDITGLREQGITVAHAPGCNAQAVAEYVITSILTIHPQAVHAQQNFCIGIVGYGHIGQKLASLTQLLGWRTLVVDPFIEIDNPSIEQHTLAEMLPQADAVSLHVPLTMQGLYPTYHMIRKPEFMLMKPTAMLINAARGAVVSQDDLIMELQRAHRPVVLDVFEFEPHIPKVLIDLLTIATPHIAGYSLEGKANGSLMIYQALCHWQKITVTKTLEGQLPPMPQLFNRTQSLEQQLPKLLSQIYPIMLDDQSMRSTIIDEHIDPTAFDALRKHYPLRREWAAFGWY